MTKTSRLMGGRRVPLWLAAAVVAVVLVAVGVRVLGNGSDDDGGGATIKDTLGQEWRLAFSATPAEVPAGEPVTIVLTVTNVRETIQSLTFPTGRQVELRALDEAGTVVWQAPDDPPTFRLTRSVSPGSPVEYRRTWETAAAPPGPYRVEGSVLAEELRGRSSVRTDVVVR